MLHTSWQERLFPVNFPRVNTHSSDGERLIIAQLVVNHLPPTSRIVLSSSPLPPPPPTTTTPTTTPNGTHTHSHSVREFVRTNKLFSSLQSESLPPSVCLCLISDGTFRVAVYARGKTGRKKRKGNSVEKFTEQHHTWAVTSCLSKRVDLMCDQLPTPSIPFDSHHQPSLQTEGRTRYRSVADDWTVAHQGGQLGTPSTTNFGWAILSVRTRALVSSSSFERLI